MEKEWPVIKLEANGKPEWSGGAYTLTFVYSNRGNFLIKGYLRETESYLNKEVENGLKYFCNHRLFGGRTLRGNTASRSIWRHYHKNIFLFAKNPGWAKRDKRYNKWRFSYSEEGKDYKELTFKRLPNRWVEDLDPKNLK